MRSPAPRGACPQFRPPPCTTRATRTPDRIIHELHDLVAQRLYALCCGYEDLNDHATLRADVAALNCVLVEQFIASQERSPDELVLDVDASDIPLHGDQEHKEFHAYYDRYCYLPLYVYCGQGLLACLLRKSRIDGARHAAAVIKLLVTRLCEQWPAVRIIVRGDSGFCRQKLIGWCERHGVGYVIGMARNARLHRCVEGWEQEMESVYEASGIKQRQIREFFYAARSWKRNRRIITRLEFGNQGINPRFVVTNLDRPAEALYDQLYCQRGEAENRIKETQLDLFGTRASSGKFLANWLRVMFSALAYTLMLRLKELALAGTELARATTATIRVKLLKIGAAVIRNTRRIRILLASHHPLRDLYATAARALASP